MIKIIKMNNSVSYINPLLIEQISETPDVMITLNNGKKIMTRDTVANIVEQVIDFWRAAYHLEYKNEYLKRIQQ